MNRPQTPAPGHAPRLPEVPDPFAPLLDALADRVAQRLGERDDLVAIAAEPLAALGLEHRAVQRLIASGKLRAVEIGRRRFTKRSYLLALVDELPSVTTTTTDADDTVDDLEIAVQRAAARRARKSA